MADASCYLPSGLQGQVSIADVRALAEGERALFEACAAHHERIALLAELLHADQLHQLNLPPMVLVFFGVVALFVWLLGRDVIQKG
ncbi:MAG: hypothetical protein AAGJ74_13480 [Pseudomonadota bacterium]